MLALGVKMTAASTMLRFTTTLSIILRIHQDLQRVQKLSNYLHGGQGAHSIPYPWPLITDLLVHI